MREIRELRQRGREFENARADDEHRLLYSIARRVRPKRRQPCPSFALWCCPWSRLEAEPGVPPWNRRVTWVGEALGAVFALPAPLRRYS